MLQNEYLLAKFYADTAQNEPSKVWSFGCKIWERYGTLRYYIFQLRLKLMALYAYFVRTFRDLTLEDLDACGLEKPGKARP